MKFLNDKVLERLRGSTVPDLSGTRYQLRDLVARGGMGVVYSAEDENLNRRVALKVLDSSSPAPGLAHRLLREAQILAQLEHPGIVPVHDVGTLSDGRVFYTMKFVEGARLDQYLKQVATLPERLRLFLRICDAVAFAHARGVLHRDLKPANVMVGPFGEILVMDWGLAKALKENSQSDETILAAPAWKNSASDDTETTAVTGHGTILGTPGYMSPEQERGETEKIDARSDIFSLGALLKFVAQPSGESSGEKLPRALRAICEKASAPLAENRYAAVADLAVDVSRFLDGLPVSAYSENLLEKSWRFFQRHQVAILLITAYLVMRALVLFFFTADLKEIASPVVKSNRARENLAAARAQSARREIPSMNKILLGLLLGTILGAIDGASAWFTPEVRPELLGIIAGSSFKGLVGGVLIGWFARKVKSIPLGVLFGLLIGALLALGIALMPDGLTGKHYYKEIIIPGSIVGLIVGFATQKYGAAPQPKQA